MTAASVVFTIAGKDFRFVLFRRGAWASSIQAAINTWKCPFPAFSGWDPAASLAVLRSSAAGSHPRCFTSSLPRGKLRV